MSFQSRRVALGFGVVMGMLALAPAAQAAVCAPHNVVVDRLAAAYNEAPRLVGTTQANRVIEVFASPNFETWTLTVRHDGGKTCLIASGEGRQSLDDRLAAAS